MHKIGETSTPLDARAPSRRRRRCAVPSPLTATIVTPPMTTTAASRPVVAVFLALIASLAAAHVDAFSPSPPPFSTTGTARRSGRVVGRFLRVPATSAALFPAYAPSEEAARASFFPALTTTTTATKTKTALMMAKGGVHGRKKRMMDASKKKKNPNPNRPPGKHRKTSKRDHAPGGTASSSGEGRAGGSGSASMSAPQSRRANKMSALISGGSSKKSGPPWQVMNEKDAKKNVEAEKLRRERIRLGLESPSESKDSQEFMKADTSSNNRLMSETDRSMMKWRRFNPDAAPANLAFVGGYLEGNRLPPSLGVPEVAFLGRSNVGKSSLLNRLAKAGAGGDVARVGKTPGATASVNLYALLGKGKRKEGERNVAVGTSGVQDAKPLLGFVDLPGFGYAKLSKTVKERVEVAAELYLGGRRELALGVLLVDSRRTPTDDDRAVLAALYDMGVPLVVVATKSDKLKANEVGRAMERIRDGLGLPDGQPLRVSGVTGEGTKDLWRIALDACETRVKELKTAIEEGRDDGGVLRETVVDDEEEEDDFYNKFDDEEDVIDEDEENDDIFYDQGYDWARNSGQGTGVMGADFYDQGSDGDEGGDANYFLEQERAKADSSIRAQNENEAKQKSETESFKLKNLRKVAREMERRGEL